MTCKGENMKMEFEPVAMALSSAALASDNGRSVSRGTLYSCMPRRAQARFCRVLCLSLRNARNRRCFSDNMRNTNTN